MMQVVEALNILKTASLSDVLRHQEQLQCILQRFAPHRIAGLAETASKSSIPKELARSSSQSMKRRKENEVVVEANPNGKQSVAKEDQIDELIASIVKSIEVINKKLAVTANELVGFSDWDKEDARVIEGTGDLRFPAIRSILSLRSLGLEFAAWFGRTEKKPLDLDQIFSHPKKSSPVKRWVYAREAFIDKNLASQATKRGLRLLLFEKGVGKPGASIVFLSALRRVHALKYKDIKPLATRIQATAAGDIISSYSGQLLNCQSLFDRK